MNLKSLWLITADAHIQPHEQLLFSLYIKLSGHRIPAKLIDLSALALLPKLVESDQAFMTPKSIVRLIGKADEWTYCERSSNSYTAKAIRDLEKPNYSKLDIETPMRQIDLLDSWDDISLYRSTEGCCIGHTPALETILASKKRLTQLNAQEIADYKINLLAADLAQQAIAQFLKCDEGPPKAAIFYNDYNIQQAVRSLCISKSIPATKIAGKPGSHSSREFYVSDCFGIEERYLKRLVWPAASKHLYGDCSYQSVFLTLFTRITSPNAHTYSPSRIPDVSLRNALGIDTHKKVITLFTSSNEEIDKDIILSSLSPLSFPKTASKYNNQHSLVRDLIDIASSNNHCVHLIVRIHPRSGEDKRGLGKSPELSGLLDVLHNSKLENITVIEPNSDISSYWLGFFSDLSIVQASSIGLELACLGALVAVACIDDGLYTAYPEGNYYLPIQTKQDIETILKKIELYTNSKPQALLRSIQEAASVFTFFEDFFVHDLDTLSALEIYELLTINHSVLSQFAHKVEAHRVHLEVPYLPSSDYVISEQPSDPDKSEPLGYVAANVVLPWAVFGTWAGKVPRYKAVLLYLKKICLYGEDPTC